MIKLLYVFIGLAIGLGIGYGVWHQTTAHYESAILEAGCIVWPGLDEAMDRAFEEVMGESPPNPSDTGDILKLPTPRP